MPKMDSAIMRNTQPANMTIMQYSDDLYAKSCKVADFYAEGTLNDIIIEMVDSTIYHSLCGY